MVEEGEVEAEVVAHHHRPAHELEERGEHLADPGGVHHHGVVDPGEGGDERGDALVGPHEGLVGAEQFAAPVRAAATSVSEPLAGDPPVVSTSTTTKVTWWSGVPRSSKDPWRATVMAPL